MSDTLKLGQIITTEQERDAVHIAVAPVVAAADLYPGQHIGLTPDSQAYVPPPSVPTIGIVDPFLKSRAMKGDRFWLFLYPGSIKSLRHDWTHPAFVEPAKANAHASRQWIQDFADGKGCSYEEIIEAAQCYIRHGDYFCQGGRFEGEYVPDEFWPHYENATGEKVEESKRGSFFSCSC